MYSSISLPPTHIYIVGRPTKKLQSQCQVGADSAEPCQGFPWEGGGNLVIAGLVAELVLATRVGTVPGIGAA